MQMTKLFKTIALCGVTLVFGLQYSSAQPAAWVGAASGADWNTAAGWSTLVVPGSGTNVFIGVGTNLNYNSAMTATTAGGITNRGTLNINAAGFNNTGFLMNQPGGGPKMFVNNGGAVNVTGNLGICSNAVITVAAGGSVAVSGQLLIGSNPTGGGSGLTVGAFGIVTNNGGLITAGSTFMNAGNASVTGNPLFVINGGTNNLGTVSIGRPANSSQNALGTDGLIIYGGFVNMNSITLGNNNFGTILISSGATVTNNGFFKIQNQTASRAPRLLQQGGMFVNLGIITNFPNVSSTANTTYSVTGGTNMVGGFQLGDGASGGVVAVTIAAPVYVGSGGINSNGVVSETVSLNSGGILGAITDWTNSSTLTMNGGNIYCADPAGTAHNITSFGSLNSGALTKTGPGTLTLAGANTCSSVSINAGSLIMTTNAAGVNATLANATTITVAGGTTFDVSALTNVAPGFVLGSAKTIAGVGTVAGAFTAGGGAIISPAGVSAQGTLNFAGGLSASNANFNLELTSDHTGIVTPNDVVNITGDFTVSGTNNIVVLPVGSPSGTYKIITYTGNFNGGLTNLASVSGTFVNPPGEIDLVVVARPAAKLFWRGDGTANLWNTAGASNWLNGASLDVFFAGDTNRFDDSATNFTVNIFGNVNPASATSVTVDSTNNYTFADGGSGNIGGATGLTKTNSGSLTILTGNDYTGVTALNGGSVVVTNLANGGSSSPIGSAANGSANIAFNGGALAYLGGNKTIDRGATLQANGGTLNVSNSATTLTLSGNLTGAGSLTKTGNGQLALTGVNDYKGGTIINAGIVRGNPAASTIGTNTLTLAGSATSSATFQFAGDAQVLSDTLNIVGTNNFTVNGGNDTASAITGSGTIYLNGSGSQILTLQGVSNSFTGTFYGNTLPTIRLFPSSGTNLYDGGATFNLGTGSSGLINRDGGFYTLGALAGGASTTVKGSANSGTANTTYFIGGNNTDSDFSGVISTGTGGSGAKVHIVKIGSGKLTLSGANTYNGNTTVSNGVLALGDGVTDGSINSSATISIFAGAILDVSSRSDTRLTLGSGQTLQGLGTVLGSLTANGMVAPGNGGTGILTVTNDITLNGTAWLKLNNASSPTSDKLSSSLSTVTYGGTLVVTNVGGALAVNNTFTLFSGSGLSGGTFGTIVLPNYYTWDTSNLGVNGSIKVTAILPPPTLGSVPSGSDLVLNAANGAIGGPIIVLSSTNVALPLAQWTKVTTGNFDGSGNYGYTASGVLTAGAPQTFYILQVQ